MVELPGSLEFLLRGQQSTLEGRGVLGASTGEPLTQDRFAGRGQEDQGRIRNGLADLTCPLHLDLQQHRVTGCPVLTDGTPGRAVAIAREVRPLQQLPGIAHGLELLHVAKEVVLAFDLPWTRGAGGSRHRQPDVQGRSKARTTSFATCSSSRKK